MLADKIRNMRKSRKLTQDALAEKLVGVPGICQNTLSRLEKGSWIPRPGQLAKILDALESSPEDRAEVEQFAREVLLAKDSRSSAAA